MYFFKYDIVVMITAYKKLGTFCFFIFTFI